MSQESWGDKGDVKEYFRDNVKNRVVVSLGPTDVRITYNNNSRLFELQVVLMNNDSFNFDENCYTPKLQIRGGDWKVEDILENVELLDKTNGKLSFKSSILERTFEDIDGRLERNELYGIILSMEPNKSDRNCFVLVDKPLYMVWGM